MKEVPIWEKTTLTLDEAAAYTGIGVCRLRAITDDENCPLVLLKVVFNRCRNQFKRTTCRSKCPICSFS